MAHAKVDRKTTTSVTVATPNGDTGFVTAWAVREFAAALVEVGIPDNARVIATHDTGGTYHLVQLRVHHVIDHRPDPWPGQGDDDTRDDDTRDDDEVQEAGHA